MQYGNQNPIEIFVEDIWFKSYYVVWKPNKQIGINLPDYQFKSYYVVWKQEDKKITNKQK